ncbi:MAG TPA: hypothetical protein VND94_05625, partial [Terriglobia bacterium]|nr:hypothetical protein [Terriglobia bacterium]
MTTEAGVTTAAAASREGTAPPGNSPDASEGRVLAVRGAVIDVAFPSGALPLIDHGLRIEGDGGVPILAEVQAHLDAHR